MTPSLHLPPRNNGCKRSQNFIHTAHHQSLFLFHQAFSIQHFLKKYIVPPPQKKRLLSQGYIFLNFTFLKNLKSTSSRLVVQINEATALRTDLDCGDCECDESDHNCIISHSGRLYNCREGNSTLQLYNICNWKVKVR